MDADGVLLRVSEFWAESLGYTPDEMVGQNVVDFLTEESREFALSTVFPQFFRDDQIKEVEYEFRHKDGSIVAVVVSAIVLRDDEGNFVRTFAIAFDHTGTKRAQALLNQKQRSETVGQLVGGVAHEFNNLLSVVLGNLEALLDEPDHPNREEQVLSAIRATRRGASLTQQLLTFGRPDHLRPKQVNLNKVVRDIESMLQRLFPEVIEFETVSSSSLWPVRLDLHQLDTALLNLATNARDAMPNGGKFSIETANIKFSEDYVIKNNENFEAGRYVMVAISDTGIGIPREHQDHVVEPFFTTKPSGEGSGMGLAMVQGFVNQSRGIMRVHSEVGFGTTVKLYFPAMGEDEPRDTYQEGFSDPAERNDRLSEVLVVEDEEDVRKIIVSQLRSAGLKVMDVASGDIAVTLLDSGYRPKLILSDVILSGKIQGPELGRIAHEKVRDLKVVFLSGYPNEAATMSSHMLDTDVQLIKPVRKDKLIRTVKRALEELEDS